MSKSESKKALEGNEPFPISSFSPNEGGVGTLIIAHTQDVGIPQGSIKLEHGVFIGKDGSFHEAEASVLDSVHYTELSITAPETLDEGEKYLIHISLGAPGKDKKIEIFEFESYEYFTFEGGVSYTSITGISPTSMSREALKYRNLTLRGTELKALMDGYITLVPGGFLLAVLGGDASTMQVRLRDTTRLPDAGMYRVQAILKGGGRVLSKAFLRITE